jgi:hypothetical protein
VRGSALTLRDQVVELAELGAKIEARAVCSAAGH